MALTYQEVLKFLEHYFQDYTRYAQDPATIRHMYRYYTPDFEFTPFIASNAKIKGRDNFLRLMSSHPSSHESLVPRDIMIDPRKKTAVVLLDAELADRATGRVLVKKSYHVLYRLTQENRQIRIKSVLFFEEILPPGTLDIGDVLKKDQGMAGLFRRPSEKAA